MKFGKLQLHLRFLAQLFLSLLLVPVLTKQTEAQDQTAQTPDVQQMQKKLEQLEQELRELKQQINAAQQLPSKPSWGPSVPVETDTRQTRTARAGSKR
jgi:cell shape-determining protein MreC